VPLSHLAILAALSGLTEALPVSSSGHAVVAGIWLDASAPPPAVTAAFHLGAALALLVAARRRFLPALADGVRAVARPALLRTSPAARDALLLAVAGAVSLATDAIATPRVAPWAGAPTATGAGLCLTAVALASTALVSRPAYARASNPAAPSLSGAVALGLAHGAAAFPGASRVGVALAVLLWLGVKPTRALELSLLLTVPLLIVAAARTAHDPADLETSALVLAFVLAFTAAAVGVEAARTITLRRRIAALALWLFPLGLATLAYAHTLSSLD
jgi:undecaprenyl-diphosphatase